MRAHRQGMLTVVLAIVLVGLPAGATLGNAPQAAIGMWASGMDQVLSDYVARVNAQSAADAHQMGSLWSDDGAFTHLATDLRAMHAHDLISIVVTENASASADGSVKSARGSNASSQVASLFGKLRASNSPQTWLSPTSESGPAAQGQSTSSSNLNIVVGGQIVGVLPNGILLVEAERVVAINQQTQMIRLRGLIRPSDVNSSNQVLSTAMTDLELEVVGKGIINDYTYRQNPLVRFLEPVAVF